MYLAMSPHSKDVNAVARDNTANVSNFIADTAYINVRDNNSFWRYFLSPVWVNWEGQRDGA